jgi:hypothetical protein
MTEDPNVRTDPATGEQVVLEPGDEGYVESRTEEAAPVEDVAPPQDLTLTQEPGESDAEFMQRQRSTPVVSESPGDIVPNVPQITMGSQEPVEEEAPPEEGEEISPQSGEGETAEPAAHVSAADLIAQAEAAETHAELDAIEAQADGRVTVINAVNERRAEL